VKQSIYVVNNPLSKQGIDITKERCIGRTINQKLFSYLTSY
jgi:hypothetical protein